MKTINCDGCGTPVEVEESNQVLCDTCTAAYYEDALESEA